MAFKCGPDTWGSLVPFSTTDTDDGLIIVDDVKGNGDMTGRHRKGGSEKTLTGKCKKNKEGFSCDRDGFHYEGDIFVVGDIEIVVGRRSPAKNAKRKKDEEEVDGDEVWVGVKTST